MTQSSLPKRFSQVLTVTLRAVQSSFSRATLRRMTLDVRGSNAVEFALMSLIMLPIMAGVADFSRYLWNQNEVAQATRAGAQYATGYATDYTNIAAVVRASSSLGGDTVNFTVSTNQCYCGVALTTQMIAGNAATVSAGPGLCTSILPTCTSAGTRGYLKIIASFNYPPILGTISLAPTVSLSTIMLRVQ